MPAVMMNGKQSLIGKERVISGPQRAVDTDSIDIEDDIPIPGKGRGESKYPVLKLAIGQSFFIDHGTPGMATACHYIAKAHGRTIVSRIMKQGAIKGLRVWRTS